MKVFVVEDAPCKYDDGYMVSGKVAYGEAGEVIATCIGRGNINVELISMGYTKDDIYHKAWVNLSGSLLEE